jgi:proteasome activator subunit 4
MFRPKLCPFDVSITRAMEYMSLLLPVMRRPELEAQGYLLWFSDFMEMWEQYGNGSSFESVGSINLSEIAFPTI